MLQLKQRREFLRVAAVGQKWAAPGLVLQARRYEKNEADDWFRIGYTVSRKVGGAVVRNRARRRLREAVEQVMPAHAEKCRDYVVIARSTTVARPFGALVDDLETALKRLDSYRDASIPNVDAGGS